MGHFICLFQVVVMTAGIVYVAYGKRARDEFFQSISFLRRYNDYPISLISNRPYPDANVHWIEFPDKDRGGRQAKLNIDLLSPYDHTMYIDADTRPYQSIHKGFKPLDDGWDFVVTISPQQNEGFLWKCSKEEIWRTIDAYSSRRILSLQGGVFFFRKNPQVHKFFHSWRQEWGKFSDQDQGAMLRAMAAFPLHVWLLGRPWNGGAVIGHLFGRAARRT